MKKTTPAVFLDRDGTLIHDAEYLKDIKDLKFFDNTAKSIQTLNLNNILAILITNQSGVARGYFDENNVLLINNELNRVLKAENAYLDGFYYCPHHPKGSIKEYSFECSCRKPKTGMIDKALEDFPEIDLKKSYVIGDKPLDIQLGINCGCRSVLVKTGYGLKALSGQYEERLVQPDFIAEDIEEAVNFVVEDLAKRRV